MTESLLKILCHPVMKFVLAVVGFLASFNFMRSISPYFDLHTWRALGPSITNRQAAFFIWLTVLVVCISLLIFAMWFTSREYKVWHKIDFSLLTLLNICLVAFCVRWLFMRPFSVYIIILAPLTVYFFTLFVLTQLVVRIRDKSFAATAYWWKFFNLSHMAPKVAVGALLIILFVILTIELVGTIGLVTGTFSLRRFSFFWNDWRFYVSAVTPFALFMTGIAATLCALNYLAAYILGLSARYEAANTEKLRHERFKSELITNVSHDIRTPLTSIINYTDLLKQQQLQGSATEYVNVLDKKAIRLKQLLNDLIDASQASSGTLKVDIQPLNLTEMLGQVAGEFSDIFDNNKLSLVLRQPDEALYVQADSRHLYRAIENLFSNAAKYSLEGTRVFAEIYPAAKISETSWNENENPFYHFANGQIKNICAYFVIRNTSKTPIDMPVENLTEQFIRGDLARHGEGSGLGLYIAKSLVELMGGRLEIVVRGDLFEVRVGI